MICKHCGKDFSLIYPESVNTRLQEKMICIECERWLELFDEVQINPEHIVFNGNYYILKSKSYNEVKEGFYFSFIKKGYDDVLFAKEIVNVGPWPIAFEGYFEDNAKIFNI